MSIFTNIIERGKNAASRAGFAVKTHTPEILAGVGIGLIITGTVTACINTTRASDILSEHRKSLEEIEEVRSNPELVEKYNYDEDAADRNTLIIYRDTAWEFIKLYAVPASCIFIGIGCLLKSNDIFKQRWLAAAGAYEALNESVNAYRKRVAEELSEDREKELWNNIKAVDIREDSEDGEEMPEVKRVRVADRSNLGSPYAVLFDELNPSWRRDAKYNRNTLIGWEQWANAINCSKGHVFLSDVLELMDYRYEPQNGRTDISPELAEMSRNVGWTYDKDNPYKIHFSVLWDVSERAEAFRRGEDASCLIDFNIDGDIRAKLYGKTRKGK